MLIAAVGDVHGCVDALSAMLEVLEPLDLPVVFLGDYVDRGPSSLGCVETLIVARSRHPDWTFLRGNHEAMLLEGIPYGYGPGATRHAWQEYSEAGGMPPAHREFLESTELYKAAGNLLFVHGGVSGRVDDPIEKHPPEELLWTYDITPRWTGPKLVRGHLMVPHPIERANHVSLDTGCWWGGWLTAGILDPAAPAGGKALVGYLQTSIAGGFRCQWIESAIQASKAKTRIRELRARVEALKGASAAPVAA